MRRFALAHGADWRRCAASLGRPGHGLGFVYLTEALLGEAGRILDALRGESGVQDWIGTVGTGVLATGTEYQDAPAIAAMVAELDGFTVFSGRRPLRGAAPHFAVVHADPAAPDVAGLVTDMASKMATGHVVGGLSSSRSPAMQIANELLRGGLSGAAFGPRTQVSTRVTQGCIPFPGRFRVTECVDNVVFSLDGRPALEVLLKAVGGTRAQLLVGLPVPGDETGDYTARNLIAVDPKTKAIAIGDEIELGSELFFCRRDAAAARADLSRILRELGAERPAARGALYFSCVARGEHLFGARGAELGLVREVLGDVPLVGFFCNGEISRDRLYGYTGVLTLFH